jgi:hypothetical protein
MARNLTCINLRVHNISDERKLCQLAPTSSKALVNPAIVRVRSRHQAKGLNRSLLLFSLLLNCLYSCPLLK